MLIVFILLSCTTFIAQAADNRRFQVSKNLDYFNLVFKDIDLFYVDSLNPEKTIQTAISAMLKTLDPYTEFYAEEEATDFKTMISGNYGGIGAVISGYKNGQVIVSEPYKGMPADRYGLRAGDVILEIDGQTTKGKAIGEVTKLLRGQSGSSFQIKIQRPGEKKAQDIKIVRSAIQVPSVPYYAKMKNQTGYILLTTFTGNPSKEFKDAFLALKKQGITSLIIDLRENGGGLLEEAVSIANYFLPKGKEIVSTRGRNKKIESTFKTTNMPLDTEIPLTVLINEGSASASEILAGALQDLDRAVIIGQRSFGKGLVQNTRNLPYGAKLKITTAKYYIPSGRCVQALDYTNRGKDGKVKEIPDSLTTLFHTAAGREVRDGRGIMPDVSVEEKEMPTLVYALDNSIDSLKNVFDFATEYRLHHSQIAPAEEFTISDEDYAAFKKQLKVSGFTYDMRSEKLLKQLKETINLEGYSEQTSSAIKQLEDALQHNLDKDLDFFAKDIKRLLCTEIVTRYQYQTGGICASLREDPVLKKAIEVLNNKEDYKKTLSATAPKIK